MCNQLELLYNYNYESRDRFNTDILKRDDNDIINEVLKVIVACQRNRSFIIHLKSYNIIEDPNEIHRMLYENEQQRIDAKSSKKKKENIYDYIPLKDSDIKLLKVTYFVATRGINDPIFKMNNKIDVINQIKIILSENEPNDIEIDVINNVKYVLETIDSNDIDSIISNITNIISPIKTNSKNRIIPKLSKLISPYECDEFDVLIAIPRIVNKYYFRILGNTYSPMYQIVDGSTYNNSKTKNKKKDSVTLKTIFMPIRLYRSFINIKDANKNNINCVLYSSNIFNKQIHALKYIFAKYGLIGGFSFLGLRYITISKTPISDEDMYSFTKNDIFINVPKMIFDNDSVTQSAIATILANINKNTTYEGLFDIDYWLSSLGQDFGRAEKKWNVLESFENIYDISTMESIALPFEEKCDIYHIFRWMIREYSNLKIKDNIDLSTKKIRFSEYIASFYAMRLSKGIHRISDIRGSSSLDIRNIKKALITDPMFLINQISKSGKLVVYRNNVNDNDATTSLKFTFKGISGMGENSREAIPNTSRAIYPSYLGRLDTTTSSPSDPGLSGILCPYIDIVDNKFSDYEEPMTWQSEFSTLINNYKSLKGMKEVISFKKKVTGEYDEYEDEIITDSINTLSYIINPIILLDRSLSPASNIIIIDDEEDEEEVECFDIEGSDFDE